MIIAGPIYLENETDVKKFVAFLKQWRNIKIEERMLASNMDFTALSQSLEIMRVEK